MKWSAKIGTFAGIGVFVHATFLILIVWVGWIHWQQEQTVAAVVWGILFILGIFACVVLHEFGHALTARRFGIRTRDIILLPIGGVARLERMPDDPRQELLVALAGPAVNVVIATVIWIALRLSGTFAPAETLGIAQGSFFERLMVVNVVLIVFNMIPAFPMDGGRVLRALLAMRMDYARATRVAATFGQGFALLFALLGLMTNPFLLFIALFVWIGAAQESAVAQMKAALGDIPVAAALISDFRILSPRDPLSRVVEYLLAGSQQDFPVTATGEPDSAVVGVLTRSALLSALARHGQGSLTEDVMQRQLVTAQPTDPLDAVVERMQSAGCRTIPVLEGGRLVGLLSLENVGEFVSVQSALGGRKPGALNRM